MRSINTKLLYADADNSHNRPYAISLRRINEQVNDHLDEAELPYAMMLSNRNHLIVRDKSKEIEKTYAVLMSNRRS